MATDETSGYALHRRLDEVLGPEHATALMERLPATDWTSVATKQDLAAMQDRIDARFERVDARFEGIDARFDRVDARFERIEDQLERVESRLGLLEHRVGPDLDQRFEAFASELRSDFRLELARHLHTMTFTVLTAIIALGGVLVAAVKL